VATIPPNPLTVRRSLSGPPPDRLFELKTRTHQRLLTRLSVDALKRISRDGLRGEVSALVERLVTDESLPITLVERDRLVEEILDEVFGLGPLEPLLKDPTISDILVNGYNQVFIERAGKLSETNVRFADNKHLMHIIEKIVSSVGRRIDESVPLVDARLADGSRVNAIIPPLAIDGPSVSIRRFGRKVVSNDDMIRSQTLTRGILEVLGACVEGRMNIVVSGGTGSGKTTFLNALSRFLPEHERVITIEDTAELQLQVPDVVRFETRPANIEGQGQITQRQLLATALRMRPDRILLGEARGAEALDMLQAMSTGVEGSMTTIHANTPADAFSRMETMVMMAKLDLPSRFIRQQMASNIHLVVQTARLSDGSRKVVEVSEVVGMTGMDLQLVPVFVFERTGIGDNGRVQGRFRGVSQAPKFLERLRLQGIRLSPKLFEENTVVI
jgi:pilus assembly protein CpaF